MEKYVDFTKIPDNIKRIKIDIGISYSMPHSTRWLNDDNKNNDLYVFCFEPNPDCYNSAEKYRINLNLQNNVQIIKVALSDYYNGDRIMDFYNMKLDCGTSSLNVPTDTALGEIKDTIKVPVFSLKDFFDIFPWDRFPIIEYIKIDAQGSDFDIIKGGCNYLKDKVVYITAEPESAQYKNCEHNTAQNMEEYLNTQNFQKVNHYNTRDPTFINKSYLDKSNIYIYQIY
jgi:FkbM family methyltransferase